jgi:hypothetical protein
MGSYLQQYGVEEERRGNVIKLIVAGIVGAIIIAIAAYFIFHNYPEKKVARRFLDEINAHNYRAAYRDWGCTDQHPCRNYDFNRFLQDWGPPSKASSPWKIASTDSCKSFLTINVQAQGAELQSLAVQRSDHSLSFAPAPECQERKWHWRQFFHRIFHGGEKQISQLSPVEHDAA